MKLAHDRIADQVHLSLVGSGGERIGFVAAVERQFAMIRDPTIAWQSESGDAGFLRALTGRRRDVLQVRDSRFAEYFVVIYARDRGTVLRASWLLVVVPSVMKDIRRAVRLDGGPGRFEVGSELDWFDATDLADFVAVTRLAFARAAKEVAGSDDLPDSTLPRLVGS